MVGCLGPKGQEDQTQKVGFGVQLQLQQLVAARALAVLTPGLAAALAAVPPGGLVRG